MWAAREMAAALRRDGGPSGRPARSAFAVCVSQTSARSAYSVCMVSARRMGGTLTILL
jgi:hypothetical protein